MMTSFADGAEVPLFVIGTAAKPVCGNPSQRAHVWYDSSPTAWMNSKIFAVFLATLIGWCRTYRKQRRVFITLDNCASHTPPEGFTSTMLRGATHQLPAEHRAYPAVGHPSEPRSYWPKCDVYILFLPKNTTAILQPMDR